MMMSSAIQENSSFWCWVKKGFSKRWHLSLDLRKEPGIWKAGWGEFPFEEVAGSIGIAEGGLVCLAPHSWAALGLRQGGRFIQSGGSVLSVSRPTSGAKGQQEVLRVHGVPWSMAGKEWSRPGLSKTQENRLSPGAVELWILLWRRSYLDAVSVFCHGCSKLQNRCWLRAAEICSVATVQDRSNTSEYLDWNQILSGAELPPEPLGEELPLVSSSFWQLLASLGL